MKKHTKSSLRLTPETIRDQMKEFVHSTKADELIVVSHIYDHAARLRSYELVAGLRDKQATSAR